MVQSEQKKELEKAIKSFDLIKYAVGSTVAVVIVILAGVFWIQDTIQKDGEKNYYPKLSGTHLEQMLQEQRDDLKDVQDQNKEIIRILGNIEGSLKRN